MPRGIGTQANAIPRPNEPAGGEAFALLNFYFEFNPGTDTPSSMGSSTIGICSALPSDGTQLGADATSISWAADGSVKCNGVSLLTLTGWDATDFPALAVVHTPSFRTDTTDIGPRLYFILNGTVLGSVLISDYLSSPVRVACSLVNNSVNVLTMTGNFASSSWTQTPPTFSAVSSGVTIATAVPSSLSDSLVFIDENTATLSNGDLTVNEGSVNNHTPCRTGTNITW